MKEFRAQSSVFLAKRGDGLKSIEGTLTAFHAAKEKGGVEKMEDRVVLYGALRQLAAACQAYMDSDPFFKKRRNAVERLAQQVDAAMESISGGGNTQAFDLASTQYQMEKDAYGGMGKEDFYQKYFGGDDEKRKEHSLNVSRISSQADKQEIADADRPYAQACAILGTIRGEEITNLKNQFESDPLMKSILEEQEAVRDKVHYVGTESGPKTFLARSGKENARYMAQLRLFDFSRYYGERLGCPADFAGHAQVDTVHENTHLVVNETFHTAGRSYSVPVDKLAEGDEEEQQRTMGEIKQVLQERNQSSQRLYELGNSYLNAVDSGELLPGQWEGWRAHRAELFHLQRQLGYSYVLESYSELGNNSRMLKSAKVVESAYEQHKKGELKDDSEFASNGYGDLVQDPKRMQAYLRFGYEAADQPSNKKEAVEAGMDPTTLFSNSLIECMVFAQRAIKHSVQNAAPDTGHHGYREIFHCNPANEGLYLAVKEKISDTVSEHAGIVRTEQGLEKAMQDMDSVQAMAENAPEFDTHEVYCEMISDLITAARLIVRGALFRKESRGCHFRADFPHEEEEFRVHTVQCIGKDMAKVPVSDAPAAGQDLK